ncbi:MAG: hypothetical protein ACC628_17590, partial [Pirellulaceae bacterium]
LLGVPCRLVRQEPAFSKLTRVNRALVNPCRLARQVNQFLGALTLGVANPTLAPAVQADGGPVR